MVLNDILGLDTLPVRVNNDGTITENITEVTAPEYGSYGEDILTGVNGWTAWNGASNQHGYDGPIFHASEVIGGGLEKDILNTPGYYAVEVVYQENEYENEDEDEDENYGDDYEPIGWVLLHKPLD